MSLAIRNFCIIAHIDHGKSTLADRMLEITGTVKKVDHAQTLDTMDIEQERGITIKMTPARMTWKWTELNLIDTPGHVDFQYEVSRSLSAVEWAVLLIDASQGIQAQTLSVLYSAINSGLTIIPVMNKIDLPAANPERVAKEIEKLVWIPADQVIGISAKSGLNVTDVLAAIVDQIPAPVDQNIGWVGARALIFDSVYDAYRGVVVYVKVLSGSYKLWDTVYLPYSEKSFTLTEVWYLTPKYQKDSELRIGQIGYFCTWQKSVRDAKIWDTIMKLWNGDDEKINPNEVRRWNYDSLIPFAVHGFSKAKPFVYAGVYPVDTVEYDKLKEAFSKLTLNDSAVSYEHEVSKALGLGFRCGFLGMLHMDIVKERLSREYGIDTLFTTPTVAYLVKAKWRQDERFKSGRNVIEMITSTLFIHVLGDFTAGLTIDTYEWQTDHELANRYEKELHDWIVVRSGADMISKWDIDQIYEPIAEVEVVWPKEYAGAIMKLVQEYRWSLLSMEYLDETRVVWRYEMPMGEMIVDFYDRLKSATKWYATLNYEFKKYKYADMVTLDVMINSEVVEAFSLIVHESKAYNIWSEICERLKDLIPKHLFSIPIQAAIGTKIIARETISAQRKDVIAKCYGWDISRKRKLLEKQKEGKKKMKAMGNVNVPSDVFIKMVTKG
jgi:GTP-binding protein LepA